MSQVGISAVLITKNEAKLIGRCLRSVQSMDEVVVLDTGSTDETVDIARGLGAKVVQLDAPIVPFHFAEARNRALREASNPWVLSIDADEILRPGAVRKIRKAIEEATVSAFNVTFINSYETNGKVVTIKKAKIFRKDIWAWRYRVHEQLVAIAPPGSGSAEIGDLETVSMEHLPLPNRTGRRGQNIELMKLCIQENPEYIRAFKHLGQELMLDQRWSEAIPHLAEFLEKTPEDFYQKSVIADLIAECYAQTHRYPEAFGWHETAATLDNRRREPFYHAAVLANKLATNSPNIQDAVGYVGKTIDFLDRLMAIPLAAKPEGMYTLESVWGSEPRRQMQLCERQLIALEKAVRTAGLDWQKPPRAMAKA